MIHPHRNAARRRRTHTAVGISLLAVIALTACSKAEVQRFGMPLPGTEEAERMLNLWQGSWIAALAVGVVVWGLIIWAAIFHRKKHDRLPPQVRENTPIEALFTITPLIMVSVLFFFTARDEAVLIDTSKPADVTVDVVAYQWSWKFYYEDDGVNPRDLEDGIYVVGRTGQKPTLVIPENRRIQFNLYSQDVVHSFWIPAFLFKRDANPYKQPRDGKEYWQMKENQKPYWDNEFQVQPNRQGTFAGRCAELCGTDHSQMLFTVKVVSWSEYEQFVAEQRAAQEAADSGAAGETGESGGVGS